MVKKEDYSVLVDAPASEEQIARWQDLSAATLLGSLWDQYPPGFLGKIEPGVMSYYH